MGTPSLASWDSRWVSAIGCISVLSSHLCHLYLYRRFCCDRQSRWSMLSTHEGSSCLCSWEQEQVRRQWVCLANPVHLVAGWAGASVNQSSVNSEMGTVRIIFILFNREAVRLKWVHISESTCQQVFYFSHIIDILGIQRKRSHCMLVHCYSIGSPIGRGEGERANSLLWLGELENWAYVWQTIRDFHMLWQGMSQVILSIAISCYLHWTHEDTQV